MIEMQKALKPSEDTVKKLIASTWEPFSEIPYDKFQKFTFRTKSDLMNYILNYISHKGSSRSKTYRTILGNDGVKIYGLVGYKSHDDSIIDTKIEPSFFIMYYFRHTYSECSGKWVDCLELYSIVVPDTLRRQGIAKSILMELESLAISKNIEEVHIKAVISPSMASLIKNMKYNPNGNIMNYCKVL
jgi:hypothetical protein